MALNIKDDLTSKLARELAQATGESITLATRAALTERLRRVRAQAETPQRMARLTEIIERGRNRAMLDPRSADEILGYDTSGLPG